MNKKSLILLPALMMILASCGGNTSDASSEVKPSSEPTSEVTPSSETSSSDSTSAPTPTPVSDLAYDFSKITEKSTTAYTVDTLLEALEGCATENPAAKVTAVTDTAKVFPGDGSTSGNSPMIGKTGFLKFASSKASGSMTLTLNVKVSKIILSVHDYFGPSDDYPTTTNATVVNDISKTNPYNADLTPENLEYELTEASDTIKIECAKRTCIFSMNFVPAAE